jgi:hypothetical protein
MSCVSENTYLVKGGGLNPALVSSAARVKRTQSKTKSKAASKAGTKSKTVKVVVKRVSVRNSGRNSVRNSGRPVGGFNATRKAMQNAATAASAARKSVVHFVIPKDKPGLLNRVKQLLGMK